MNKISDLPVGIAHALDTKGNSLENIALEKYKDLILPAEYMTYLREIVEIIKTANMPVIPVFPMNGAKLGEDIVRDMLMNDGFQDWEKLIWTHTGREVNAERAGEKGYLESRENQKEIYITNEIALPEGTTEILILLSEDLVDSGYSSEKSVDAVVAQIPENVDIRVVTAAAIIKDAPSEHLKMTWMEPDVLPGTINLAYRWIMGLATNSDLVEKLSIDRETKDLIYTLERLQHTPLMVNDPRGEAEKLINKYFNPFIEDDTLEIQLEAYINYLAAHTIFGNIPLKDIIQKPLFKRMFELEMEKNAPSKIKLAQEQHRALTEEA